MRVSISLGGSLLTGRGSGPVELDPGVFQRYARVLRSLHQRGHELVVVCGGGRPARYFIAVGRELGAPPRLLDLLGVKATHVNALLLMAALGEDADQSRVYQRASDFDRAPEGKILVGGGFRPGSSTDYRAAIFAGRVGAQLVVNATDVDGVYTRNPRLHGDAVKLERLTYGELEDIVRENTHQYPGEYGLFDLKGVRRLAKLAIPLVVVDGRDPQEIARAVEGGHRGSTVTP